MPSTDPTDPPHPYQTQAYTIFSTAWIAHTTQDPSPTAIPTAASALSTFTAAATFPIGAHGVYIWSILLALTQHVTTHPRSLDLLLRIYASAIATFPPSVSNEYGHGSKAGLQQLKWWIVEESDGFQALLFPADVGTVGEKGDRSEIGFSAGEMGDVGRVVEQVQAWRQKRTEWIVAAAVQARCCALEIVVVGEGRQIAALVDAGLNRGQGRWSRADFVGACVLLRGCAKTLRGLRGRKFEGWEETLEVFVRGEEGFVMTYHAAVCVFHDRLGGIFG